MKKLLLLLLIVPVLGFGQQLFFTPNSLELTDVFSFSTFDNRNTTMTVPEGKIWFLKIQTSISGNFFIDNVRVHWGNNDNDYGIPVVGGSELYFGDLSGNSLVMVYEYKLQYDNFVLFTPNQLPLSYIVPDGFILEIISKSYAGTYGYSINGQDFSDMREGLILNSGDYFVVENPNLGEYYAGVLHNKNELLALNAPNQTTPTLYPNPTSSLLALNSDKEYDIEVYDMLGNKLMAVSGNSINMEHLSTATYIVKATDKSNNEELTYKVVKN